MSGMEYKKYTEDTQIVYSVNDGPLRVEILLGGERDNQICVLVVYIGGSVKAIDHFEMYKKEAGWFFYRFRVFPPDEITWEIKEEHLSDKEEVAQAIFLEKISQACMRKIAQLLIIEGITNIRELRAVLRRNLPS
jgi:hypothetical protein